MVASKELLTDEQLKYLQTAFPQGDPEWPPYDGYIRVSSLRERKKDTAISPSTQIGAIERYARENRLYLRGIVWDINVSGKRELFMARKILPLVNQVREGKSRGVIVYNVSRWGRSQLENMMSESELMDAGGRLLSCTEPNDVDTPAGRFGRSNLHAIAEFQRGVITESWKAAHANRIKAKLPKDGRPRFGYVYIRDEKGARYEQDPERAPMLALAYRRVLRGETLWSITQDFRRHGVTMADGGSLITYMALQRALKSGFGAGLLISGTRDAEPTYHQGAQEPVITEVEWEEYRARHVSVKKSLGRTPTEYPLKGLVRCGSCRYPMGIYATKNGERKFACRTKSALTTTTHTGRRCDSPVGARSGMVEAAVKEWLRAFAHTEPEDSTELMARRLRAFELRTNVEALRNQLAELERMRQTMLKHLAKERITDAEFDAFAAETKESAAKLEQQIIEAEREAKVNLIPPNEVFDAILSAWTGDIAAPGMLNTALRQAIHCIYVGRGHSASSPNKFDIVARWEPDLDREPKVFLGLVRGADHESGKYCSRCLKWKSAEEFYRRNTGRDKGALTSWCKECHKSHQNTKYAADPEDARRNRKDRRIKQKQTGQESRDAH